MFLMAAGAQEPKNTKINPRGKGQLKGNSK